MTTRRFLLVFALFIFLTTPAYTYAQRQDGIRPSFKQGYARNSSESKAPHLWRGLVGAWIPGLGVTGNILYDVSVFKNHGVLTGMDVGNDWVVGQQGHALNFNGSSGRVHIGVGVVTTTPFTICILFYDDDGSNNDRCLVQIGDSDTPSNYFRLARDQSSNALVGVVNDGVTVVSTTTNTYDTNTWNSACVVFFSATNREVTLNADEANKGVENVTSSIPTGVKVVDIGYEGDSSPGDFWNGQIAVVLVYNRAFTPKEKKQFHINPFLVFERKE